MFVTVAVRTAGAVSVISAEVTSTDGWDDISGIVSVSRRTTRDPPGGGRAEGARIHPARTAVPSDPLAVSA